MCKELRARCVGYAEHGVHSLITLEAPAQQTAHDREDTGRQEFFI